MWEDRADRLEASSLALRVRDRLSKPFLERIETQIYDNASVIYVLSEYTASNVVAACDIDRSDFEIVPYPVDSEVFSPTPETRTDTTDEPLVLFVGRYNDPRKNIPILLEAFARVKAAVLDARLQLIRADPDAELVPLTTDFGIKSAVDFLDHVPNDDLPQYYRAADVFAIPSHQEGLAVVGLETMACATPVVSTRCGGPEDYVRDGETGYLVPTDDVEGWQIGFKSY